MSSPASELTNEIVKAGAGAGKTTDLVRRVTELSHNLKERHGHFPNLVVTTFTRKATQELKERLIIRACENQDLDFLNYVSSPSKLFITTIDGVLSRFLRRYGYLWSLDPAFTVISEQKAQFMGKRVLRELLGQKEARDLLEDYSVDHLVSMLRKAYALRLMDDRFGPHNFDSFSQARSDILRSLRMRLDPCLEMASNMASSDPRWEEYFGALQQLAQSLAEGDFKASEMSVARLPPRKPPVSKNDSYGKEQHKQFSAIISSLKEELKKDFYQETSWPEYFKRFDGFEQLSRAFDEKFKLLKIQSGQMEIQDLALFTLNIHRENPELTQAFSQEWDYWLIDEFQDTSPLQVEILKALIGDRQSFMVGDPQQSIYLFRGARSEVFEKKMDDLKNSGGTLGFLKVNYRSSPSLLEFFNDFFTALSHQFSKMQPRSNDFNDTEAVAHFISAEQCQEKSREPEYNRILERINGLLATGARYDEICILGRKHKILEELGRFLESKGVPSLVHRSSGFFQSREIIDALSFLKFLLNPHDNKNLVTLSRSPWVTVSDQELYEARRDFKFESLWHCLLELHSSRPNHSIKKLKGWLEKSNEESLSAAFSEAIVELGFIDFSMLNDLSGRREANLWKLVSLVTEAERLPGLCYLDFIERLNVVYEEDLSQGEGDATAPKEPNRVNLMTIHASKGLKFGHVIVPHCEEAPQTTTSLLAERISIDENNQRYSFAVPLEGAASHQASVADRKQILELQQRELNEHDRLLYVALTRAQHSVTLSWTGSPRPNSWIQRSNWPSAPGIHKKDGRYCYEVHTEPVKQEPQKKQSASKARLREPFVPPQDLESFATGAKNRYSVSSLIEAGIKTDSKNFSLALDDYKKPVTGVLIHKLMEALAYQPELNIDEVLQYWFGNPSRELRQAMNWVRQCKNPDLMALIKNGRAEWGFQLMTQGGRILEGQIDLWGKVPSEPNCTWVIDYKTGSEKYTTKAFEQLSVYSLALRRFEVTGDVKLGVVFPLSQNIEVLDAPSESELVERFPELGSHHS